MAFAESKSVAGCLHGCLAIAATRRSGADVNSTNDMHRSRPSVSFVPTCPGLDSATSWRPRPPPTAPMPTESQ